MIIRKVHDGEVLMIAEMTRQLFEDEPSDNKLSIEQFENRLIRYIEDGSCAFLFIDKSVIGYALVNLSRSPYYLIDFFICREFRRSGNGTFAFNMLMKELDTNCIDLDVFCWNDRGRRFWESLGFRERAIIMRKQ